MALRDELQQTVKPDESLCKQILNMGFDIELVREALKNTSNDMQKTIENLLKMQADGTYQDTLKDVLKNVTLLLPQQQNAGDQPSTSTAVQNLEEEMEVNFQQELNASVHN